MPADVRAWKDKPTVSHLVCQLPATPDRPHHKIHPRRTAQVQHATHKHDRPSGRRNGNPGAHSRSGERRLHGQDEQQIQCRREDSNLHGLCPLPPQDSVSTSSTTSALTAIVTGDPPKKQAVTPGCHSTHAHVSDGGAMDPASFPSTPGIHMRM